MMKRWWSADTPNLTVGLDLGDRCSDLCLLDGRADVVGRERVRTSVDKLEERFRALPPCRVVLEVGTHSPWVSRLLAGLGHEVIVARPRKRRRKNNRLDAEYLARQGRADPALLAPIRHRGQAAQEALAVVRARDAAVRARSTMIASVRGLVKSLGGRVGRCSTEVFARRTREALPAGLEEAVLPLLALIEQSTQSIRQYDRKVEALAQQHPETERLRQVAGVGPITSLAYVLVLETPERFRASRSVGPYLGLCSDPNDTGEEIQDGRRISKAGDALLRRLLVQSAQYILGPFGPDTDLRRYGLARMARGGKAAKKKAAVAVARKLAVLLHRLWVSGERYEPLRNTAHGQELPQAA
jgi:transposase